MTRLVVPLILFVAAIGLFVVYTNPTYQATKALSQQVAAYDNALTTSNQLKKMRDQLLAKRDTFSTTDMQKLQSILPDNVDNIRLIIDINSIAARHNLTLKNVQLGSVSDSSQKRSDAAVGSSGSAVGSVDLGFGVSSNYDNFMAFLADLEHSLRIVDVEKMNFKVSDQNAIDFILGIRTYWLH